MGINRKIDQIGKPNFIYIGAPKTASTWLNYCLSKHSKIYIPPWKELNYFNRCTSTTKRFLQSCYRTLPQFLIETAKGTRVEKPELTLLILWLRLPPQSPIFALIHMLFFPYLIYRKYKQGHTDSLRWYTKFFLGRLKLNPDNWYKSLFEPTRQQICGEITPVYDVLPERSIEYIMSFNKDMRIIYIIRNPIEREWSMTSMYTMNPGGSIPISVVQEYTHRFQAFSNYLSNLKRYLKYVQPENLFLGFYEDILFQPNRFLASLQKFLDVPEEDIIQKPRYTGGYKGIKLEYAVYLAKRNLSKIQEMASIFGGYTRFWLDVAFELCQKDMTSYTDQKFLSTPFATNVLLSSQLKHSGAKDFQSGPLSNLPFINKLIP